MDNKDNQVTLSKNKDVVLMQNIHIKTADRDVMNSEQPLRYYLYKASTIEAAIMTAPVALAVPVVAIANVTAPAAIARHI
jgi:hypothetical protein